jgi:hypothetical protein
MSTILEEKPHLSVGTWPTAPYKGLNFYTASDAPLFCERDAEVEACGQLAAHFGTKMLLLHGRTGTGKSSFLRAGLFPRIFLGKPNFFCLTEPDTGEPCLIRSTADPIASITDTLHSKLQQASEFKDVPSQLRQQAVEQLTCPTGAPASERATRLQKALQLITSKLVGTFVLAIDQAEEVFTLNTGGDEESRDAYFTLLEDLCYDRFDIKVVLALRTEYYGQFADNFRFGPDLSVSTVRSGLEQFMLHGIQDAARLEAAILRPTLKEPVAGLPEPYVTYNFAFEPGLALVIAADVVDHCGESSTLPVMQMVCLDLYTNLVLLNGINEIHERDYAARGGVEGVIDRFIENSVQTALAQCSREATPREIEGWRDILSSLVARQEGGALTSLLLPEAALGDTARKRGITQSITQCLEVMAHEKFRLLRSVNLRDPKSGKHAVHYSLGHDALAPSLFHWKEARKKVFEERERAQKRTRHITNYAVALILTLVMVTGASLYFSVNAKKSAVWAVLRSTDTESQTRARLLLLAALEKNTSALEGMVLPMPEVEAKLRDTLIRAPVFASVSAAVGFAGDGNALVLITPNGEVITKSLRATARQGTGVPSWKVDLPPIVSSAVFAAGFVEGLDSPVIYKDDKLLFNAKDGVKTGDVNQLNPQGEKGSQKFPDFGGGVFRLTAWGQAQGLVTTLKFYDLQYDPANETFKPVVQPPTSISFASRFTPVYAETSQLFAFTERDERGQGDDASIGIELYVASRNDPLDNDRRPIFSLRRDANPSGLSPKASGNLIPSSIAFLPDGDALVYRETIGRFTLIEGISRRSNQAIAASSYTIPQSELSPALDPLRPQWPFGRPVLAAARNQNGFRVAWLTDKGMSVFHSQPGQQQLTALPDRSALLTSLRPVDSFTHLRFSNDGELLLLSQQLGNQVVVRVWDISDARLQKIKLLSRDGLLREACQITKIDPGGNMLTNDEFRQLPVPLKLQPCSE